LKTLFQQQGLIHMTKSKENVVAGVLGQAQGRAQQAMDKGNRLVHELSEIARGNAEALVTSSKTAASGLETLGRTAAEYGQKNFNDATAAFKSLTTVKTPGDLFQVQAELVRSTFDNLFAQSSKLSDSLIELSGAIAAPLADRYVAAVERVKTATLDN
jgi:hypothetical protein